MDAIVDYVIPIGTLLVVTSCAAVAHKRGDRALRRAAAAMAFNVGMMVVTSQFVPWQFAWLAWLGIDGLTAYIILRQPAGKVQAVLGFFYLVQCTFHVSFYLVGSPVEAMPLYQNMLTWVLGGQVLTLLGGTFHDTIHRNWCAFRDWRTHHIHGANRMDKGR